MIQVIEKSKCTGCGACANVCPKSCIQMKSDELGFQYPVVSSDLCINCGKCDHTCPMMSRDSVSETTFEKSYAIKAKDNKIRWNSSSGGVFSLLALKVIDEGGTVYGAAFDNSFHVHHVAAMSPSDITPIRGSKIIQSSTSTIFQEVKRKLDNGEKIYFSGTPCQIYALLRALNKKYDNLITQDIICHGVCSLTLYEQYLDYKRKTHRSNIQSINFRSKETGWRDYSTSINYENGDKTVVPHAKDELMRAYLRNYALRPSCYACPFKGKNRMSDITLADFWGAEHFVNNIDDDKGVSFVVCHSAKGEDYIKKIMNETDYCEVNYQEVIKYNMSGEVSPHKPEDNDEFCEEMLTGQFPILINKYCKISISSKMKRVIKTIIKKY